ncbi:9692_t:CDS:2 [Diversispora eburnea]|uniref:Mitochondrial import inner membrane translocase subunit Tim21 n=1 Tax=Diversispora eburnea TaxID=1213867 RepID=A0A9N8WRP6_9GLOM|nr:9692_t:CDS:2 [Diversispora eburnea]
MTILNRIKLYPSHHNSINNSHSNIKNDKNTKNASEIIKRKKVKEWSELSTGEKVIGAAKVTSNFSIIVIGIGLFVSYFVITELFGPSSSTKKVLGLPMTGQGIPHSGSRLRARRVYFQDVKNVDGTRHRLLQFHVQGSISQGKALLDMVKDDNGKWYTKYLIVTIPGYGKRIFVEYNSNNSTSIDNNDNNKDNKK